MSYIRPGLRHPLQSPDTTRRSRAGHEQRTPRCVGERSDVRQSVVGDPLLHGPLIQYMHVDIVATGLSQQGDVVAQVMETVGLTERSNMVSV